MTRDCPICEETLTYTSDKAFRYARRRNSPCIPCAGKTRRALETDAIRTAVMQPANEHLTNVQVAKQLGLHENTVRKFRKRSGYVNPRAGKALKLIGNDQAECSKCHQPKPISEFTRKLSYCNECLYKYKNAWTTKSFDNLFKVRLIHLRGRALKDGVACTITVDDLLELYQRQDGKCFYTDRVMTFERGKGHTSHSLSVDRIIPEIGYVSGNVVLCTSQVNVIKNNVSLSDMEEWMPGWYARLSALSNEEEFGAFLRGIMSLTPFF